jgi:glycosyltransferase involved in cell wall biosynthesis
MVIVQLTTDNREPFREYHKTAPWFGTAPEALLQGFAQLPEVKVHVVSCTQQPMAASPEKLADNVWFHSLHVPKLGWMRTGYQGCVRAVRRKLRELQPDIVHGQGTERDCALSAVFSGYPNVLTIHGNARSIARVYRARPLSYWWLAARLEPIALRRTAGVFCNSEFTENEVKPFARRRWRVPNALRLPFFASAPPRQPSGPPLLLNIGVVEPRKQQVELLHQAQQWRSRGLRFRLRFIGKADGKFAYAARLLDEIAALRAEDWVDHVPSMNCEEIISALDQADALIHVPTEEAFGLVAGEAMARGCRLFGFAVGGVREISAGTGSADLASPGNWDELGSQVRAWLGHDVQRDATSAAVMRERYHPVAVARRHVEIYREVLSARS